MRQAGRYLPEYREIRARMSMLDAIRTPEVAAEITLQPIRRFGADAAIIFADILNPLIGMGLNLDFVQGEGPKIFNPVRSRADIEALKVPPPQQNVGYTLEALKICAQELAPSGTALIGFSGAPFTLSTYAVEGESSQSLQNLKQLMFGDESAWCALQEKLSQLVTEYLVAQAQAGAQVLQIFDSWVGQLGPREFRRFVLPYVQRIVKDVKRLANVPVIYFGTGAAALFPDFAEIQSDVIGVDWRMTLAQARAVLGPDVTLQGNLDPTILAGPKEYCLKAAAEVLADGAASGRYIFNVGHGLLPHTPIENVSAVINLVKQFRR